MGQIWDALVGALASTLRVYEGLLEPVFGDFAWGWAIILLTFTVRLLLLPLAVKQTNSMRAMQRLQPEVKKIQAKYKADRSMLRTDPEKYRELRAKQQEATMKLYQEAKVNPAAGCLPLVLQMPIFFALFTVLNTERVPELSNVGWYGIDSLRSVATAAGAMGFALIAAMLATTFFQQRQTMRHTPGAQDNPQQKILLYAMPAILAVFSINLPVGVLLYWVATNLWTVGQQGVMFRKVEHEVPTAASPSSASPTRSSGSARASDQGTAARKDAKGSARDGGTGGAPPAGRGRGGPSAPKGGGPARNGAAPSGGSPRAAGARKPAVAGDAAPAGEATSTPARRRGRRAAQDDV